jgi:hypothetical protein
MARRCVSDASGRCKGAFSRFGTWRDREDIGRNGQAAAPSGTTVTSSRTAPAAPEGPAQAVNTRGIATSPPSQISACGSSGQSAMPSFGIGGASQKPRQIVALRRYTRARAAPVICMGSGIRWADDRAGTGKLSHEGSEGPEPSALPHAALLPRNLAAPSPHPGSAEGVGPIAASLVSHRLYYHPTRLFRSRACTQPRWAPSLGNLPKE